MPHSTLVRWLKTSVQHEDSPYEFLVKCGAALLRIGALFVFGTAHFYILKAMRHLIPANMPWARLWMEDISYPFFAVIYVYLLFDMVKAFIPILQAREYPGTEEVTDGIVEATEVEATE
jgi:hypothetical protein